MRRVLLTLGALLAAALGWMAGGAVASLTGLDELDPLLRLAAIALALAAAERAASRLSH
jgi:hypothetical protein